MKHLHLNRRGLYSLSAVILLGFFLLSRSGTGDDDPSAEFQLLAHTFSSGGVPATDGEIILTACSIGGLNTGTTEDGVFSIHGGDLIPLTEAGPPFLQSVVNANELQLSWDATGCVLERTDRLPPLITWTNVPGGDAGYIVLPLSAAQGFFRLRCDLATP